MSDTFLNNQWPTSDNLSSSDDEDEMGGGSMSIVYPTICNWCVLQGRGAAAEDQLQCAEWLRTTAHNPKCISQVIFNHQDWTVHQLREEMKFLIAHGADPSYTDPLTGRSPLHYSAHHGSVTGIRALMTLQMKGLSSDDMLDEQLDEQAMAHGYDRSEDAEKDKETKLANEQNIDLFATTKLGLTVIHLAAMRGHANVLTAVIEYLLENPSEGPRPFVLFDAPDMCGFTPSMYAAEKGKVEVMKVLRNVVCDTKDNQSLSSFERNVARPHHRLLIHYAALHNRVNIIQYLEKVNACHLHQDIECRYPIDLAKTFNRLGAVVALTAFCKHPYLDNNSHCGICNTFVVTKDGPSFSPIPGHRNIYLCDAIQDMFSNRNLKTNKKQQTEYHLWEEISDIGINYPNEVRSSDFEIEELLEAVQEVVKHIGLEKDHLKRSLNDCVEICRQFKIDHDDLDSVNVIRFHRLIGSLPEIKALDKRHIHCICRPYMSRKKKQQLLELEAEEEKSGDLSEEKME